MSSQSELKIYQQRIADKIEATNEPDIRLNSMLGEVKPIKQQLDMSNAEM